MTDEEKDRIRRAEEIQLYTENRCQALEKENAELKEKLKGFETGDVAWQGDMDATIAQNLELKEQNKIILEDNDTLNKWIDELTEKISDLESIVESLQSCTNCEHFDGDNYCKSKQCVIHQLDGYCPNWEKAE